MGGEGHCRRREGGACTRRVRGFSTSGYVYAAARGPSLLPGNRTIVPSHLSILPHCPGQGLCFSLSLAPHYSPYMQTNWDSNSTTQQSSGCCPQSVPKQGSPIATAATTLQPAAHLQCAMALSSQATGSPSLCQPLLSPPQPPVIGKAERSPCEGTGVGHNTCTWTGANTGTVLHINFPGKPHSLQPQCWCQGKPCTLPLRCLRTHMGFQGWTAQPWCSITAL